MKKKSYFFVLFTCCLLSSKIFSQIAGDYRSAVVTGGWETTASWETFDGNTWVAASSFPLYSISNTVTVLSGHNLTINGDPAFGSTQTYIPNTTVTGTITIASSKTLWVANTRTLTVDGSIINNGTSLQIQSGTATIIFNGIYQHAILAGTIPTATWNVGSTCNVTGSTSAAPSGANQNFHHFIWNCASQSANCTLSWNGNTIGGNVTITETKGFQLRVNSTTGTSTTINGNLIINGATALFTTTGSGVAVTVNINGNVLLSAGTFSLSNSGSATGIWNLKGNLDMTISPATGIFRASSASSILYFAGNSPQSFSMPVSGTTITAANIQLNTSAILNIASTTVFGGTGTFNVQTGATLGIAHIGGIAGSITTSGTKTYSTTANYVFNGGAAQVTSVSLPANVNNLTINNTTGITLSAATTVNGVLNVAASSTLTTGANNLTLGAAGSAIIGSLGTLSITGGATDFASRPVTIQSTSAGTGRISTITGDNVTTGLLNATAVTVQRYIPSKASRAWSLVTSPVGQLLNAGWQQQVHITGAGTGGTVCPTLTAHTNGFDATTTNAPSMFIYNASNTNGNRWTAATNTNATSTAAGTGFRMNIRGPRATGCALLDGTSLIPAAATLSATGTISNAAKNLGSFTIDYPNTGSNNYVLIGNPYPSQISFSTLVADNIANMGNNYAIYAPGNTAGNYAYWDPGTSTYTGGNTGLVNATGNIIASGQAIFVRAQPVSTLTLSFNEAQKTATTPTGYFRTTNFNEMVRIAYMLDDTNKADEIIVRYSNDARINNTTIGQMDIESMNAGSQYLTSLKSTKAMAVQTRSLKTLQTDTVALNVISSQNGTYKLSFSDYENFTAANIYLLDKYTNSTTAIKDNPVYSFTVDRTIAATQGQRFALVFAKAIVPQAVIAGIKMYPNPANKNLTVELPIIEGKYTLRITDVIGKQVYQNQLAGGVQAINISKLAQGNYVVEITDTKGNRKVEKLVKQ